MLTYAGAGGASTHAAGVLLELYVIEKKCLGEIL
jgi:hypothetical protein